MVPFFLTSIFLVPLTEAVFFFVILTFFVSFSFDFYTALIVLFVELTFMDFYNTACLIAFTLAVVLDCS